MTQVNNNWKSDYPKKSASEFGATGYTNIVSEE